MIFKTIHQGNQGSLNKGRATVLFYHPSCIHCIMMRKEWESMKEKLRKKRKNCNIYEVSGEDLHGLNTPLKSHIDGFPSIINIENGQFKESFHNERSAQNMMDFAVKNENQHKNNKKRKTSRRKPKTVRKRRNKSKTLKRK